MLIGNFDAKQMQTFQNQSTVQFPNLSSLADRVVGKGREEMVLCKQWARLHAVRANGICVHVFIHCSREWGCTHTHTHATSVARFQKAQGPAMGHSLKVGNP